GGRPSAALRRASACSRTSSTLRGLGPPHDHIWASGARLALRYALTTSRLRREIEAAVAGCSPTRSCDDALVTSRRTISVVVPLRNEEANVPELSRRLKATLDGIDGIT